MKHHHVIPERDIYEHEVTPHCGCLPLYNEGVWCHYAFDQREGLETGPGITPSGGNKGWGLYEAGD